VPRDAELWELEWHGQGAIVTYLKCPRYGKGGCYAEDDWGQGVLLYWKRERISWCGCRKESGMSTERKSAAKIEEVAQPREAKAQQSSAWSREPESTAKERESGAVTPDSCLGNKSDIFHHNNENNQLERRVQPPRDVH